MKKKIIIVEDADILFVLAHFDNKELNVIERYNNMLGEEIKKSRALNTRLSQAKAKKD